MRLRPRQWPGQLVWPVALLIAMLAGAFPAEGMAQPDGDGVAGAWSASIADSDVAPGLGGGPNLIGRWRIEFREDGSYVGIREDIGEVVSGSWTVDGDTLTITDEAGPSSCATPQPGTLETVEAASGTYRWERDEDRLTLDVVEDNCATRALLLTIRPLTVYVPCSTEPYQLGQPIATPVVEEEVAADLEGGTPVAPDATPILPEASPVGDVGVDPGEAAPGGTVDTEAEIDALLAELTACWATGDPALVLPLFSDVFLERLVLSGPPGTTITDVAALIGELQAAPVVFERAGEVQTDGPRQAEAEVRLRIGEDESLQQFDFVLEGGQWKLADLSVPPEPTGN